MNGDIPLIDVQFRGETLEQRLRDAFHSIELIGALPITQSQFGTLCLSTQRDYKRHGKPLIKNVPSAVFITGMVFSARYSREDRRNFWEPYAKWVWGLDEASQMFQVTSRQRFMMAARELEREYDFHFPRRTPGDVVRPVFRHAIIPFYLQDDFASWLQQNWRQILEIPAEALLEQLRVDSSVRRLARPLARFIKGEETAEAATELITNMATAASLLAEGDTLEGVEELLSTNPIELSLWRELKQIYAEQHEVVTRKRKEETLRWVWSFEEHELQLQMLDVVVNGNEQPDRVVWVAGHEEPSEATIEELVYPWRVEDEWRVDEAVLSGGAVDGQVVVLGIYGNPLHVAQVPPLPHSPFIICRSTQQGLFGVPINPESTSLSEGSWYISATDDVVLRDMAGNIITPQRTLPVPRLLQSRLNHQEAGLFNLPLPLEVWLGATKLYELTQRAKQSGEPAVSSPPENRLLGTSPRVPPVFHTPEIYIDIPHVSIQFIRQTTLWLKTSTHVIHHRLRELLARGAAETTEDGVRIDLHELLPAQTGMYVLQIRHGLRPIFASPLQFSILHDIEVEPPELDSIYYPGCSPMVKLYGVTEDQVVAPKTAEIESQESSIIVRWHDLRGLCRLQLNVGDQRVPLAWDLKRRYAWIDPSPSSEVFDEPELDSLTLHVISTEGTDRAFTLKVGDKQRDYTLDSRGRFETRIRYDPLYGMLQEESSAKSDVFIHFGDKQWLVLSVVHDLTLIDVRVQYHRTRNKLVLLTGLENPWPGHFKFRVRSPLYPEWELDLGTWETLEGVMSIPVQLLPGYYELQVTQGDQNQLFCDTFVVGKDPKRALSADTIAALRPHFSRESYSQVSDTQARNFLTLLNSVGREDWDDHHLFKVATLSSRAIIDHHDLLHTVSWLTGSISVVHQRDKWRSEYGLLPAWLVTHQPIYLKLRQPGRQAVRLRVFPEVAFEKAHRGIGYSLLSLSLDEAQYDYAYVKWNVEAADTASVFLGLPNDPNAAHFTFIDELDIWPIYQCKTCGKLTARRRSGLSEEVKAHHSHGFKRHQLVDLVYDVQLYATVSLGSADEELRYVFEPDLYIDRRWAASALEGKGDSVEYSIYPSSPGQYVEATRKWMQRYRSGREIGNIEAFYQHRFWKHTFKQLEEVLVSYRPGQDIPAFCAIGRFLAAFERWQPEKSLVNLDKWTLMLALLIRGMAYNRTLTHKLCERLSIREADLAYALRVADHFCPELLEWAFTWVELAYVHAAS